MEYFAGLDVSVKDTAICVVDSRGEVVLQCSVPTDPAALAETLSPYRAGLKRVGHEAGSLSPWLQAGLIKCKIKGSAHGLSQVVVCTSFFMVPRGFGMVPLPAPEGLSG